MTFLELLQQLSIYLLPGIFAGLVSGAMGIGGGIVIVPALVFIFSQKAGFPQDYIMQFAAGTSLAVMLFTSQSSVRAHHKYAPILWGVFKRLWPGLVIGTVSGVFLSENIPTNWIKIFFGVFLLFVAFKMIWDGKRQSGKHSRFPPFWVNGIVTVGIGAVSGLLGVGGGALTVPYLSHCNIDIAKIVPVSALSSLTVALAGTIIFILIGLDKTGLPKLSTGFVYWPAVLCIAIPSSIFAPLGAKLTYLVPVKQLRLCFVLVLILTAINLLV